MIQHLHSLFCIRPILDKNTGLASYIDIIEGMKMKIKVGKAITLPPFNLISKFWIEDGIEDNQTLIVELSRKKAGQIRIEKL